MDILSKDTLALLDDKNLRKAVDELLTRAAGESSTVTVIIPKSDSDASSANEPESKQVILRRLSA